MYNLDLIIRKPSDKPKMRNIPQEKKKLNRLNGTLQKCKGHERQGQNEDYHTMEETKKTWQLNVGFWTEYKKREKEKYREKEQY